jgi:hypothetical protein
MKNKTSYFGILLLLHWFLSVAFISENVKDIEESSQHYQQQHNKIISTNKKQSERFH